MRLVRYALTVLAALFCATMSTLCLTTLTLLNAHAQHDFSEVDRILQDSLTQLAGTTAVDGGGAALVIWKDGAVVYEHAYALQGKTYSANKLVAIGSATKGLSGLVIMSMVDQGILSLDDTIGELITSVDSTKRDITIRQLFSFTSGLQGNLTGPSACVDNTAYIGTLADCVNEVLQQPLVAAPGAAFNYGSDGMHVAGRLAEIRSGLPLPSGDAWDSLFVKYVTKPLLLTLTGFDLKGFFETDNPRIDGGAGSTAHEYLQVLIMMLQGGEYKGQRVLSSEVLQTMTSDQTRGATIGYTPYLQYESLRPGIKNTRYGVGFWRERIDSVSGDAIEVASQGKFGFSPWIDFERGYCAVLSVRSDLTTMYPTYLKLKDAIRRAFDAATSVESDANKGDYESNNAGTHIGNEEPHQLWELVGFVDVLGRTTDPSTCSYCLCIERTSQRIDYNSKQIVCPTQRYRAMILSSFQARERMLQAQTHLR